MENENGSTEFTSQTYKDLVTNFQIEYLSILEKWEQQPDCNKSDIKCCPKEDLSYNTAKICRNVWIKFSNTYQKSPTKTNNNISKQSSPQLSQPKHRLKKCTKVLERNNSTKNHSKSNTDKDNDNIEKHNQNQDNMIPINNYDKNDAHSKNKSDNNSNKESNIYNKIYVNIFNVILMTIKIFCILLIFILLFYLVILLHKPIEAFILRNTQELIYPFMRRLRLISLPIIKMFPSLTDLYEDSCFIPNSFFAVDNIDCWPCETVRQVMDFKHVSSFPNKFYDSGIPFVVRKAFPEIVELDLIISMYLENEQILKQEHFVSNVPEINSFDNLLKHQKVLMNDDFHLMWKINRVTTARTMRSYFPKPFIIPATTEVSIQHFLYLDQWKGKSYSIPLTEFTNVFVTQATGTRYMVLIPTFNCQNVCKVVSVILHPRDILFYNWLYWRPVSFPMESFNSTANNNLAITYIGSFY